MIPLLQALLPALAGLLMVWAGLIALAGEGTSELGAHALAREPEQGPLTIERSLHVMHLASMTIAAAMAGSVVGWWAYPPVIAAVRIALVALLVWAVGDLAPRLLAALAPEIVPYARRVAVATVPAYRPLLRMAARLDRGRDGAPRAAPRGNGPSPQEMAQGVFSLAEMQVAEVMTPRLDIVAVDVSATEAEVISTLRRSEHARLLVYDEHPDAVVGVIYAKDMLPRLGEPSASREPWQSLARRPAFVPTAKTLDRQLRDFQRGPGHLAVVVDEFGGTAGLVTLEDILEQIVGEIQDEHDVDDVPPIQRFDDGRWIVEGGVALAELEGELQHDFERDDVATVGGLVLAEMGHVPRSGESVEVDGWRFTAELVVRRRVRRVAVRAVQVDAAVVAS